MLDNIAKESIELAQKLAEVYNNYHAEQTENTTDRKSRDEALGAIYGSLLCLSKATLCVLGEYVEEKETFLNDFLAAVRDGFMRDSHNG